MSPTPRHAWRRSPNEVRFSFRQPSDGSDSRPSQRRLQKSDALAWVANIETEMRSGTFVDRTEARLTTFGEALTRYLVEVTPSKRGHVAETSRIRALLRHPLAKRRLAQLRAIDVARYRDERLASVGPETVTLDLATLSSVLNACRRDRSIPVENFVQEIRKPRLHEERDRRLVGHEEARLLVAAADSRAPGLAACIILAIETGMRRGEIADLE